MLILTIFTYTSEFRMPGPQETEKRRDRVQTTRSYVQYSFWLRFYGAYTLRKVFQNAFTKRTNHNIPAESVARAQTGELAQSSDLTSQTLTTQLSQLLSTHIHPHTRV